MFYDVLSSSYDQFVNWNERLKAELPFLQNVLQKNNANKILDSACGTGHHAIALSKQGYTSSGCDLSQPMIELARQNSLAHSTKAQFFVAGFGEISKKSQGEVFDAVLCLGNSLPHVSDHSGLLLALSDFAEVLRKDGVLIIQNRNFDAVLNQQERWMDPQFNKIDNTETLFHRFYDFNSDGSLGFNMIVTRRDHGNPWRQTIISTKLFPLLVSPLLDDLNATGFWNIQVFGDLSGNAFNEKTSPNCVITALKA